MKKIIPLVLFLATSLVALGQTTAGYFIATNTVAPGPNGGVNTVVYPGRVNISAIALPEIYFNQLAGIGPTTPSTESVALSADLRGGNWHGQLIFSDDVAVLGNLDCMGTVTSVGTPILWQTNNIYVTNAQYSAMATNASDGYKIASTNYVGTNLTANLAQLLANTHTWTGTNTYSGTVNLNGPVTVQGASGGTSNVPIGGVTLHFVNGFYTGTSVP